MNRLRFGVTNGIALKSRRDTVKILTVFAVVAMLLLNALGPDSKSDAPSTPSTTASLSMTNCCSRSF